MASPFDELDRQHLIELHRKVDLLLKVVARLQNNVAKMSKARTSDPHYRTRKYMRGVIREQRDTLAKQKLYVLQLENELRLRGLE